MRNTVVDGYHGINPIIAVESELIPFEVFRTRPNSTMVLINHRVYEYVSGRVFRVSGLRSMLCPTDDDNIIFEGDKIAVVTKYLIDSELFGGIIWMVPGEPRTIPPPPPRSAKYKTYIMQDLDNGYCKIGKSWNPVFREGTLLSQKPSIKLVAIHQSDIEKKLHKEYLHLKIRGEWFMLSPETLNDIVSRHGFEMVL